MEYKRLKENIEILYMHNELHTSVMKLTDYKKPETDLIREIVSDCREILNKIEQGTLIELPCKVRDKLYRVVKVFGKYQIQTLNVDVLHIEARNIWFMNCSSERETLYSFSEKQIGVDVFLTREEAEKRLKELQE